MEPESPSEVVERIRTQLSQGFLAQYRLRDLLGKGGMGVVYRATHLASGRDVAIKFMAGGLIEGDDAEARFYHEAEAMKAVDHPNLVEVLASGKDGPLPYIVFAFVDGRTLKQILEEQGRLPVYRALEIVAGVLQGLKVAHGRQLVHRDIKSENILIDADGTPRVADFGIAKSDRPQQTRTGVIIGTPAYMAPEQAMGKRLDPRCDLYSVGIVLFELLTGQLPFGEENSMTTMMAHINEPVPAPSYLVPGLPLLLDELLAGALAKRPEDRYPSAGGFAIAIERSVERLRQVGFEGLASGPGGPGAGGPSRPPPRPEGLQTAGTRAVHLKASGLGLGDGVPGGSTTISHVPGPETAAARAGGSSTVRVLERTRADRPAAGRAAGLADADGARTRKLWAGAGAGVLLLAAALALRPGPAARPGVEDPLAGPEAEALRARLDELSDPQLEPDQRHSLLRLVPPRVEAGREALRQLALRRLEELRDTTPPSADSDFHFHLALAALGDLRSYGEVLRRAAAQDSSRARRLACEALADGLERGLYPGDEQAEELDQALWRLDRGKQALEPERQQFFRAASTLGSDVTVAHLEEMLRTGERRGYPRELQAAGVAALRAVASSARPGAEAARALLEGGIAGGGKVRLEDDETLAAMRNLVDGMDEAPPRAAGGTP